jgi:hypothetical protein
MRILNGVLIALAVGIATLFTGCMKEGPAEKAGEAIDKAAEKTADKAKEMTNSIVGNEGVVETTGKKIDTAIEKTGEKIDQIAEKTGDKMQEIGNAAKEKTSN